MPSYTSLSRPRRLSVSRRCSLFSIRWEETLRKARDSSRNAELLYLWAGMVKLPSPSSSGTAKKSSSGSRRNSTILLLMSLRKKWSSSWNQGSLKEKSTLISTQMTVLTKNKSFQPSRVSTTAQPSFSKREITNTSLPSSVTPNNRARKFNRNQQTQLVKHTTWLTLSKIDHCLVGMLPTPTTGRSIHLKLQAPSNHIQDPWSTLMTDLWTHLTPSTNPLTAQGDRCKILTTVYSTLLRDTSMLQLQPGQYHHTQEISRTLMKSYCHLPQLDHSLKTEIQAESASHPAALQGNNNQL